jgi:carbamoyltransferase
MVVLGIHDGHTSTAVLLEDGRIRGAISEERLTRIKGQGGFPRRSIATLLEQTCVRPADIAAVVVTGVMSPLQNVSDYSRGRQKFFPLLTKWLPINPRLLISTWVALQVQRGSRTKPLARLLRDVGIPTEKLSFEEHHSTHAATAYYLSPFSAKNQRTLVVTLDGSGDGLSGSVSLVNENGSWKRCRAISSYDSIGMVYSRVTQYLGMKPWEHEYKLMGLAPYADPDRAQAVAAILSRYFTLTDDGAAPLNRSRVWGNSLLDALYRDLRGHRFDAVAAGVQIFYEAITTRFIQHWMRLTGARALAVAGGCFMNIKANRLLLELDGCDELFVMPSCGDESCAIGAAILGHSKLSNAPVRPLEHLYWGPECSEDEILSGLQERDGQFGYEKCPDIEQRTAELLVQDNIIGRLSGGMEWGSRALGNRSIVANPSRVGNLRRINAAIKQRDFWMPFAPSILWEQRHRYVVNPTDYPADHMTMGFPSTALAQIDLVAAIHPSDFTLRPQLVKAAHSPKYHRLLSEFEKLSGISGVLNTSFNLHGEPIVCNAVDALHTFTNSDLDFVTLNDYLVWKLPRGKL